MIVTTVACRSVADSDGNRLRGCGAGWPIRVTLDPRPRPDTIVPGITCPNCQGPLHCTGTYTEVTLYGTCALCHAELTGNSDERMSGLCMTCLWGTPEAASTT